MRRFGFAGLVLCAMVVTLAPSLPHASVGPVVDAAAFRGQGHLAFVWGNTVYILDGRTGSLHHLAGSAPVIQMAWSPDGRWLAYIRGSDAATGTGELWLVRGDGSGLHRVMDLPADVQTFTWSPTTRVLAVTLNGGAKPSSALWFVPLNGRPFSISAPEPGAGGIIWSSDATRLAYSVVLPFRDPSSRSEALYTMPATGGASTRRLTAKESGIIIAGWWPDGKGLFFWLDPQHSASIAVDGLQLFTMPLGGKPHVLTTTLTYADWLSLSGRRLLLVAGSFRPVWSGKHLAVCDVEAGTCTSLPRRPGVVTLDPAWSSHGNRIAYVQARDLGNTYGFSTNHALQSWVRTRTLWVADAQGNGAHALIARGGGVYSPQWSADGRHVLYVRDNALWLIDVRGGPPTRIVGPFPQSPAQLWYYGHISWSDVYIWNRR